MRLFIIAIAIFFIPFEKLSAQIRKDSVYIKNGIFGPMYKHQGKL
jgi:hypothetical protein